MEALRRSLGWKGDERLKLLTAVFTPLTATTGPSVGTIGWKEPLIEHVCGSGLSQFSLLNNLRIF